MGLLTDTNPTNLPLGALIQAKNVVLNEGVVQKAPGSLIYNTSHQLDGAVVALHDWWPTPFLQRLIAVTEAGSIYRDTGNRTFNGAVSINSSLTGLDPRAQFVAGGNETAGRDKRLFLFSDGNNQLKVLTGDGSSFVDVSKPALDWTNPSYPRVGIIHRNRLWAFQGQRGYASKTGDHEDFQDASILTQSIFPGEGSDIIGCYVFKGRLFAFKEGEFVYYLVDSDTDSANWFWRKLASNFGLSAPNAIVNAIDDMLVGNSTGTVTSYKGAETLGEIESADIFRIAGMERYLRRTTHPLGLSLQHALYDEELKQMYFTYRSTYTTTNDMLINVDLNQGQPKITYLQKGTPTCLALRKNNHKISVPFYGDASGYVHQMNYEDRLEGAASYEGSFQTAYTDFQEAEPTLAVKQKHWDFLWIEYVQEGDHDLSIDVFIDGKFMETVTTKMEIQNVELDTFLLGTDRLSQFTTMSNPIPLHGMGRRISFRCYNAGSNQSFQIASLTVGFRPAHEGTTLF
jgi:hypothetical protein